MRGRHEDDGAAGNRHLVLEVLEDGFEGGDGVVIALAVFAGQTLFICQCWGDKAAVRRAQSVLGGISYV